ncbi:NAD-binding protein [Mycena floridula]|nr:NAD-binding protein [Mycena floridula]
MSAHVAFITGCSDGGIGAALAQTLAERDCRVYASTRNISSMKSLVHPNIIRLAVDVTDSTSILEAVKQIYLESGRLDICVSNAGTGCPGPLLDIPLEKSQAAMDTNFWGLVRLVQAVVPRMASDKHGLIVAVGSIYGDLGTPFTGIYNASKAALRAYTETLYMECLPLGIDVMLLSPGGVVSNVSNNSLKAYDMPENSLYRSYNDAIIYTVTASQAKSKSPMPTGIFAEKVADKMLAQRPPQYFSIGAYTTRWRLFRILPRGWVLNFLWNALSQAP